MNAKDKICKVFQRCAPDYEAFAKIHQEIEHRLLTRLDYFLMQPRTILDLGCGTGILSAQLKQRYPEALVVSTDIAQSMLAQVHKKQTPSHQWPLICADMNLLPFDSASFDLIVTNQAIHWSSDIGGLFAELNRVLRLNGCLMFSTLGPDTFQELRQSWAKIDSDGHVNEFLDMHHLGDALLAEHFLDPVVDMEYLTVHYPSVKELIRSLKKQGVHNHHPKKSRGLTSVQRWNIFEKMMHTLSTDEGKIPLSYEVIYGHAWKGATQVTEQGAESWVSVDELRQQLRKYPR